MTSIKFTIGSKAPAPTAGPPAPYVTRDPNVVPVANPPRKPKHNLLPYIPDGGYEGYLG